MTASHGTFVWYELMTSDIAAAQAFYESVVGWGVQDSGATDRTYLMFTTAGAPMAGLMQTPERARSLGARPAWFGYVGVEDVDAASEKARGLGGSIHVPAQDIPNVGRFSMISDPQGAVIVLFTPKDPSMSQLQPPRGTPGRVEWHELVAEKWSDVFDFYAAMFGWRKGEPMDMGPMGVYQLFSHGDEAIGGMFDKPPAMPRPFWLYYFNVGDIDAAVDRVRAGGGQVLNGPMQVPGGGWILQGMDPQGAMFALFGNKVG